MTEPRQDLPTDPQLSRLYREQALGEPTDAVDQRVLAAARAALASRPPVRRRPGWWQRWRMPLSLATTVMLTAMLALLVERQPVELVSAPGGEKDIEVDTQKRAEPVSVPAAPAAVASTPGGPPQHLPKASGGQSGAVRAPLSNHVADQAAAPPSPVSPAASDSPVAASRESAASDERRAAPAPLAAPPAADRLLKSTADRAPSPADWLDEIRALRSAGKIEEADRQLSEFRLAHPDYPVPEEFHR